MEALFKIEPEALTPEFIDKLNQFFSKKSYIEIKIVEIDHETEYLLSSTKNKERLLNSIDELEENKTVPKTLDEIEL